MRKIATAVLVALLISPALIAAAGSTDIPLRNWTPPFASHASSEATPTPVPAQHGRFTPETNTVAAYPPANFVPMTPCRVADTRNANGPYGGPILAPATSRTFNIPGSACAPPVAVAYSLSIAVVNFPTGGGFVTAYPSGTSRPNTASVTFGPNPAYAVANAAIVPASASGSIDIYSSGTTHLIIDINGYFVDNEPGSASVGDDGFIAMVAGTGASQTIETFTLNAPAAGFVVVNASGYFLFAHANGTQSDAGINVLLNPTDSIFVRGSSYMVVPAALPTATWYSQAFSVTQRFQVMAAGPLTMYLVANYDGPNPGISYVSKPNVVAYFLPVAR